MAKLSEDFGIADLYFFEELCALIGVDESHKWLKGQPSHRRCASKIETKTTPSIVPLFTVTPEIGRNAPSAKIGNGADALDQDNLGLSELKSGKRTTNTLVVNTRQSAKRGSKSPLLSPLSNLVSSLGLESSGKFLSRTVSVERKLGLLFTDAAHTILDWNFPESESLPSTNPLADPQNIFQIF